MCLRRTNWRGFAFERNKPFKSKHYSCIFFSLCSCRPLQTKQWWVPQSSQLHTDWGEDLLQLSEGIQRRRLHMPSYKPLCRWVQWRLPWTCYLHCHRACKLNDLGLHREVWDTSSRCQEVSLPDGSYSLLLRAPCFPEQLLCDTSLLSMSILASFQMRAEEKGATVNRMFCMRSLSVLFCSSPFLAIPICNRSLAAWNCVYIGV